MGTRNGFTLVEMLMALVWGMVVAYAAFAGFRVGLQAMNRSSRLATENQLLRAGFHVALDELDFWTAYDNPHDSSEQPLRAAGHPFHPLAAGELSTNTLVWQRQSFFAGSGASPYDEHGNYALAGYADASDPWTVNNDWHSRTKQLYNDLGAYALIDYQPKNGVYWYYQRSEHNGRYQTAYAEWSSNRSQYFLTSHPRLNVTKDSDMVSPRAFGQLDCNGDSAPRFTHRKSSDSLRPGGLERFRDWGTAFVVSPNLTRKRGTATVSNHGFLSQDSNNFWYRGNANRFYHPTEDHLVVKPANWPDLITTAKRMVTAQFYNSVTVDVINPETGEGTRLVIAGIGTTLRGARMQRGLDGF
ncbi:MAG: prepilin-type N-terminal cleavage/methylation domain-containing protein [Planctomycetota bacterium]|nr:prepilin-type N-terminal cleavage/methylation domain-containing protein [Planctomycetota bacterium]